MRIPLTLLTLAVLICVANAWPFTDSTNDRILLEDVTALTFRRNQMTSSRRGRPIEQLRCVGRNCDHPIDAAQCRNTGSAGLGDVQWRCEAEMPSGLKFGNIKVSCEGYDSARDRYVLKDSCGLEYSLEGQAESRTRRHDDSWFSNWFQNDRRQNDNSWFSSTGSSWLPFSNLWSDQHTATADTNSLYDWSSNATFYTTAAMIMYFLFFRNTAWSTLFAVGSLVYYFFFRYSSWSGLIPIAAVAFWIFSRNTSGWTNGLANHWNAYNNYAQSNAANQQRGGPGFWSGLLGGTFLGNWFGSRSNRNAQQAPNQYSDWFNSRQSSQQSSRPPRSPVRSPTSHIATGYAGTAHR